MGPDGTPTDLDRAAPSTAGARPQSRLVVGVVALVVVVLGIAAVLLTGVGNDGPSAGSGSDAARSLVQARDAVQETSAVTVSGESLPAFPPKIVSPLVDPVTDPAVGKIIPGLRGEGFDGSALTLVPDDGTPKLVLFVAHWCPHCQAEIPRIQQWLSEGRLPEEVEIHTVSTAVSSDQPNYPPSEWLAREGWRPRVIVDDDDSAAATAYALPGFPYFVLADGRGRVVQRGVGEVPVEDLEAALQKLSESTGSRS